MNDARKPSEKKGPDYSSNPNYFRLLYHRAAQQVNEGIRLRDDGARTHKAGSLDLISKGLSNARDALAVVQASRADYKRRFVSVRRWRRLRRFLRIGDLKPTEMRLERFLRDTVEPCLHLLIAGALVALGRLEDSQAEIAAFDELGASARNSYRVLYNLSCYEASRYEAPRASAKAPNNEGWLEKALGHLKQAFETARGPLRVDLIRSAETDPALQPLSKGPFKAKFEKLVAEFEDPEPRTKK